MNQQPVLLYTFLKYQQKSILQYFTPTLRSFYTIPYLINSNILLFSVKCFIITHYRLLFCREYIFLFYFTHNHFFTNFSKKTTNKKCKIKCKDCKLVLEEKQMLKVLNENNQKSLGKNIISPPDTTPPIIMEGVVRGENNQSKQVILGTTSGGLKPMRIRSWHCLIMEKEAEREWIVVVSKNAVINQKCGWLCSCGEWTFGDDISHTPIYCPVRKKKGAIYR